MKKEQLAGEGYMLFDAGKPIGALYQDDCGNIHKQPFLCTCSLCRAKYDREIRAVRIFAIAKHYGLASARTVHGEVVR